MRNIFKAVKRIFLIQLCVTILHLFWHFSLGIYFKNSENTKIHKYMTAIIMWNFTGFAIHRNPKTFHNKIDLSNKETGIPNFKLMNTHSTQNNIIKRRALGPRLKMKKLCRNWIWLYICYCHSIRTFYIKPHNKWECMRYRIWILPLHFAFIQNIW